jgi:hypothetical protein
MRSFGRALVVTFLTLAAGAAAAAPLAPHRAIYDLALAPGAESIVAAQGRIAIEFYGSPCEGYTTRVRQVTTLEGEETPPRTLDANSATFEEPDGASLRFRSETRADGMTLDEVNGEASREDDVTVIAIEAPEPERLLVPGEPYFPTQHILALIAGARSGAPLLEARVYDGTGDGRTVYDTFAVIGPQLAEAAADDLTAPLADLKRWPVRLSYFEPGPGERTPDYVIGFTLYENGVSSDLTLAFDGFTLVGTLTGLELLDTDECRL